MAMQQIAGDAQQHYANPYGMMAQGGPPGMQQGMGQGMQQRR
jgi:ATF/CREB family transcription factor